MKPGDLVKFRQNFCIEDRDGNMRDFSEYLGLVIESYSTVGHWWNVLLDGKTYVISWSNIECVVQRGYQIETG
jgi:hypothetical protein